MSWCETGPGGAGHIAGRFLTEIGCDREDRVVGAFHPTRHIKEFYAFGEILIISTIGTSPIFLALPIQGGGLTLAEMGEGHHRGRITGFGN